MKCKAAFLVDSVTNLRGGEVMNCHAVTSGEGKDFSDYAKFTPGGTLNITISKPELMGKVKPGAIVYALLEFENPTCE